MNPNSKIGMWVAFLLTPLCALAGAFISHAALSVFGIHLDPTGTAIFISSVALGIVALGFKWLHNRGLFEIASLLHVRPAEIESILKLVEERLPVPPNDAGQPKQANAPPPGGTPGVPRARDGVTAKQVMSQSFPPPSSSRPSGD